MIILKRISNGIAGPDGIAIGRTEYGDTKFSDWYKAMQTTEQLREVYDSGRTFLPVRKLPQVIAVLRLNGIEVELGEGL